MEMDASLGDILLALPEMSRLGFCSRQMLARAVKDKEEFDMTPDPEAETTVKIRSIGAISIGEIFQDSEEISIDSAEVSTKSEMDEIWKRKDSDPLASEESDLMPEEFARCFPDLNFEEPADEANKLKAALENKMKEYLEKGMPKNDAKNLKELLFEFEDIFRITLGRDPPVDMPPLKFI